MLYQKNFEQVIPCLLVADEISHNLNLLLILVVENYNGLWLVDSNRLVFLVSGLHQQLDDALKRHNSVLVVCI